VPSGVPSVGDDLDLRPAEVAATVMADVGQQVAVGQLTESVSHNAYGVGTPKMPGEPPRVQPSKKNAANWAVD
jgi:hypothetical protein